MERCAWQCLGRDLSSCNVVINIASPNGLGQKPEDVAAAKALSSSPWWLLQDAPTLFWLPAFLYPLVLSPPFSIALRGSSPNLPILQVALHFWAQLSSGRVLAIPSGPVNGGNELLPLPSAM